MKFVLYTNTVSAHQLPLAREIVRRIGAENFRYVYTGKLLQGGSQEVEVRESWILKETDPSAREWVEECEVMLVGGIRPLDLLERRSARGLKTFYQSERWFKPIDTKIRIGDSTLLIPGWLRMLVPRYRKMAKRFVRLMNDDPNFMTLPIGPWAKMDFRRLGVKDEKMIDWGYFVEPSKWCGKMPHLHRDESVVRVLYIGRLLALKRVDTIIKAVTSANRKEKIGVENRCGCRLELTIVGDGPEKERLKRLAREYGGVIDAALPKTDNFAVDVLSRPTVSFLPSVPINEVRQIMREHDVVIFASNATDGWGAVVSEALAEGVPVIGTYETGASAALLPEAQLFHCGDYRELARKLVGKTENGIAATRPRFAVHTLPVSYTPAGAMERLFKHIRIPSCAAI